MSTKVVCASNMSMYGRIGTLYLNDNDGLFPEGPDEWLYSKESDSRAHPIGCRWHDRAMSAFGGIMNENPAYRGIMWSYFSEMDRAICPTFRRFGDSRGCENPNHNPDIDIEAQFSYSINGYLGTTRDGGVLSVSGVRNPSEVFFFGEENSWSVRPDHPKFPAKWLSAPLSTKALEDTVLLITPTPKATDCFATYHLGINEDLNRGWSNVVFIDGHVDSISASDQLRKKMHKGVSSLGPAGNLTWAWADKKPPPNGWDGQ